MSSQQWRLLTETAGSTHAMERDSGPQEAGRLQRGRLQERVTNTSATCGLDISVLPVLIWALVPIRADREHLRGSVSLTAHRTGEDCLVTSTQGHGIGGQHGWELDNPLRGLGGCQPPEKTGVQCWWTPDKDGGRQK